MKHVEITNSAHPQSGKQVQFISILGEQFVYADKRGNSMHTLVSASFARKVIDTIPATVLYAEKMELLSNPASVFRLSWSYFGKGEYELRIHFGASALNHIYTAVVNI